MALAGGTNLTFNEGGKMRALALLAALGILAPHLPAPRNPYRVEVTIAERKLRLFKGDSLVVATDVAVGMNEDFTWSKNGTVKKFHFETPRGIRRVLAKEKDPLWVPPDWHFYEKAMARGLDVVELKQGERRNLSDGAFLEVRGKDVGIYDPEADLFWPWTQGLEIIIDGKIFVPPLGSSQRKVPGALGKYKLDRKSTR